MARANSLDELGEAVTVEVSSGPVVVAFDLPQPGISYLELTPE